MALAAAGFGAGETRQRVPRELAAIGEAGEWLNAPSVSAASLLGKVVVVDFCTYTCINWLRTLSYVRAWSQKYRDGLVLIGVHTPEFPFEGQVDNVRRALRQLNVEYPIVLDGDYRIWRAFQNQYWPALYLIDPRGRIRHRQFGEGEYERSERAIQRLLTDAGVAGIGARTVAVEPRGIEVAADWDNLKSPENYLGADRTQGFASRGGVGLDRRRQYAAPSRLALNQWALAGEWTMGRVMAALNAPSGRLACRFHARDLHLVMGPAASQSPIRFRVSVDGRPPGAARGLDIDEAGNGRVVEPRLYQLLRQSRPIGDRTFEIEFLDAGAEVFAFTFG